MIHSIFFINNSGDIFLEKHYKRVIPKSICDYFFEEVTKNSSPENVPPIIQTPNHILISIYRAQMHFVAVCKSEVPPLFVIEFLHRLADIIKDYFDEVSETSIKGQCCHRLLDEVLDNGFPLATESNILKELIRPPNLLRSLADTMTGRNSTVSATLPTGQLSNIPWRRSGVKYANNEAYFDIVEELDAIVDKFGGAVCAEVHGSIDCLIKLSGVPDLTLSFVNSRLIEDASLHPCVRHRRFEVERLLSFVPPDGGFRLMAYRASCHGNLPVPLDLRHTISFKQAIVTDIRKSSAPIQRMIASLNWLHRKIQRGKILVKAYQVAERIHDRRARKTKSFSKTRFVSSSFTMVQATVTELRIWLTTLNETPLSRKNREVLAYLQSTAFVTELLIFSEVMKPFCATMLRCQDLQLPGVYHDVDLATTTTVPRCILDRRCRHVSDSEDSSSDSESDSELEVRHAGRNVRSTFKSALSAGVELVTALGDRLSVRTSHSIPSFINLLSSAFGLAGYVGAMCGRLRRGSSGATVFLRHEAHFVVYGRNAFSMAAEAARSRRSLRDLFDSADLQPVDLHTLWRDTLKQIVWSEDSTSAHCRRVLFGDTVPDDRVLTLALTEVSDEFAIDFGQGPVKLKVQEQAFIKAMYNDDQLYTRFGKPLCALLDWALAKGCPEAIVESLYTSMERQCMQGALQLSSTLELRTRLAWHLPRTLAAIPTNVLERISREWLTSHPVTFLSAGSNKRKQEVLERLKSEEGRKHFHICRENLSNCSHHGPNCFPGGNSGHLELTVIPRPPSGRQLEDLVLTVPMPRAVSGASLVASAGKYSYDTASRTLVWTVGRLDSQKGAGSPTLCGTLVMQTGAPVPDCRPSILVSFSITGWTISGLKVNRLDLHGEKYKPFKGVKYVTKAGKLEFRT
uniref:MHD domain-containing protein n=1 Tax=Macrostomum lignano TaxID=282301 RepID=A0A1I8J8C5_9PLAT